jgi:hypothetical protein
MLDEDLTEDPPLLVTVDADGTERVWSWDAESDWTELAPGPDD